MRWRVEFRPEVEQDVAQAALWYESKEPGLGIDFVEEVIAVWDRLEENPLLRCRQHAKKHPLVLSRPYSVSHYLRSIRVRTHCRCRSGFTCSTRSWSLAAPFFVRFDSLFSVSYRPFGNLLRQNPDFRSNTDFSTPEKVSQKNLRPLLS